MNNHTAIIFSHSITPRLRYIVDFLSQYYGLSFGLIPDEERYLQAEHPCKINYSFHRLADGELFIHPHSLLFESAVRPVKVECFEHNGYKAFFRAEGDTTFDIFAAIFFFITRYEEYLPHKKDIYGRYAHENSTAFKEEFLNRPLVNIWLEDFRKLLGEKAPQFLTPRRSFSFQPTYDIDMAWSFRNKGFKRNTGAILSLLLKAKFRRVVQRIRVLRKKRPDPFDAYEWMADLHNHYRLKPIYFFLVAQQKAKYDRNIDVENKEFQALIQSLASTNKVGLHPSWASGDTPHLLTREKQWLEKITEHPVDVSRQHYIRFEMPATYRRLLSLDITSDFSMGYGSINGFRASIATPYYWYDLKNEEPTKLIIYPFCFMDANACYEQHLSPKEALAELKQYYNAIKSVNGTMVTIWHNSFLGSDQEFEGWREVYEEFVKGLAAQKEPQPALQSTVQDE